jgi:hypothetical protein
MEEQSKIGGEEEVLRAAGMEVVEVEGVEDRHLRLWERSLRKTKMEGLYGEVVKQAVKARTEW